MRVDGFITQPAATKRMPAASVAAATFKPDIPLCGVAGSFSLAEANRCASHFWFLFSRIFNLRTLLIMGGENCAFTNCTASRGYNKSLSYRKIVQNGVSVKNDAWRETPTENQPRGLVVHGKEGSLFHFSKCKEPVGLMQTTVE